MIVVLDTNILVSSLLSAQGAPAQIVRRWEADDFSVVTSSVLISEFRRVLDYPRVRRYLKQSPEEIEIFLKRLSFVAVVVEPEITLNVIDEDPADNRVLECAVVGNAAYIVSGNFHLLNLKEYQQIMVLNPKDFLAMLDAQ